jgi:hypothetical protein
LSQTYRSHRGVVTVQRNVIGGIRVESVPLLVYTIVFLFLYQNKEQKLGLEICVHEKAWLLHVPFYQLLLFLVFSAMSRLFPEHHVLSHSQHGHPFLAIVFLSSFRILLHFRLGHSRRCTSFSSGSFYHIVDALEAFQSKRISPSGFLSNSHRILDNTGSLFSLVSVFYTMVHKVLFV